MKATHIRCVGPKPDYSKNPRRTGTPPVWHVFAADPFGMPVSKTYASQNFWIALITMRRMSHDRHMPFKVSHPDCPAKARGDCSECPVIPYETPCRNYKP